LRASPPARTKSALLASHHHHGFDPTLYVAETIHEIWALVYDHSVPLHKVATINWKYPETPGQ
jgi:hypothetical protein